MGQTPKKASSSPGPRADAVGAPFSGLTVAFRQTRKDHATELAQDYVELIDGLIAHHGEARLVDIAGCMGVSHVTANKAVARLQRDGLVQRRPYRAIFLTDAGKRLADESRRRHQVVFQFLCALGVPERQACIDAEGVEHHISAVTLEAMAAFIRQTEPRERRRGSGPTGA
ncbi:MAG: manganese-binding transcriptional regulator MntR [Planctomycetes bacterium]|nr:manganese-binding transcriptional regulator MntR [Planctomycetota bacterium]